LLNDIKGMALRFTNPLTNERCYFLSLVHIHLIYGTKIKSILKPGREGLISVTVCISIFHVPFFIRSDFYFISDLSFHLKGDYASLTINVSVSSLSSAFWLKDQIAVIVSLSLELLTYSFSKEKLQKVEDIWGCPGVVSLPLSWFILFGVSYQHKYTFLRNGGV